MASPVDLDGYFARIGFKGERVASLKILRDIHARHPQAIPFENLDPFLGKPVRLDIASLQQKLVHGGRGGYCYEHNLLLSAVLKELGFDVTWLGARVLWNAPEGAATPRTHMVLLARVDGEPYIADVGFGGQVLTGPLRLEADVEQQTPHEMFRFKQAGGYYILQSKLAGSWRPLYRFDLTEQLMPDYEVANWFVSTNPASRFVTGILGARVDPGRRYALMNNELTVYYLDGRTEKQTLRSAYELRSTLEEAFRICLPTATELKPALENLLQRVTAQ